MLCKFTVFVHQLQLYIRQHFLMIIIAAVTSEPKASKAADLKLGFFKYCLSALHCGRTITQTHNAVRGTTTHMQYNAPKTCAFFSFGLSSEQVRVINTRAFCEFNFLNTSHTYIHIHTITPNSCFITDQHLALRVYTGDKLVFLWSCRYAEYVLLCVMYVSCVSSIRTII